MGFPEAAEGGGGAALASAKLASAKGSAKGATGGAGTSATRPVKGMSSSYSDAAIEVNLIDPALTTPIVGLLGPASYF